MLLPMVTVGQQRLSAVVQAQEVYVPVYEQPAGKAVALQMSYASPSIRNLEDWQNEDRQKVVYEIDLVFTRYPYHRQEWITDYDWLLEARLQAISQLDPSFVRNKFVKWRYVLQTSCETEPEAKQLFHGVVLKYFYRGEERPEGQPDARPVVKMKTVRNPLDTSQMEVLRKIVSGQVVLPDSTVLKVLERHQDWEDLLVVADWTGSMYSYGTQVVAWQEQSRQKVRQFVFFNDGDKMPEHEKRLGQTGGIYFSHGTEREQVLQTMAQVMQRGYGGLPPENDIEALLKATYKVPEAKEVVLIADNSSRVRDMAMAQQVKRPVKIILCGVGKSALNPDYVYLAYLTGGSLHTIDEDLDDWSRLEAQKPFFYKGYKYYFHGNRLVMMKQ